ncbi:RNA polymerase sigma factor [Actinacidiphila oryziradicis]|uniref:Sigma-70 family RNA polymerase sigma factor n=1 Tax=Actinacidiphila oryziradicis TaxID=2571141 RepID=A0A4U0SP10_9ACTN|nr:sigma-70 family RNA polymerase sigma factor [Actinacidiphila oryziradicis]TKA11770.1 sigma-70 family RNA polymerase sigma factor [Actinacidiphila oryziradicis]
MRNLPTPAQALNERFASIYATHQARIAEVVRSRVFNGDRDLADDLTAETFVQVWLSLHKCNATTDGRLFSWMATIARRTVADHYRKASNTREIPADTGDWQYANRDLETAGGYYTPAATGFRTARLGGGR